jgi:hypothetical protein
MHPLGAKLAKTIFIVLVATGCGWVVWLSADPPVEVLVDRPVPAPPVLIGNNLGLSTNNWVQAMPLTKGERARFATDILKLIDFANRHRKNGEKISAIIFSGDDFAWIRYTKGGVLERLAGAHKIEDGVWR